MIKLSKKERIIADLLCTGLMQKEIARQLNIKESTVATHRTQILRKKGKSTIKELMYDIIIELKDKIKQLEEENAKLLVYKRKWALLVEKELGKRSY